MQGFKSLYKDHCQEQCIPYQASADSGDAGSGEFTQTYLRFVHSLEFHKIDMSKNNRAYILSCGLSLPARIKFGESSHSLKFAGAKVFLCMVCIHLQAK